MTWMQTASGRAFDLAAPRAEDVNFEIDVAEALAREPRFGGHVRSGAYSVAQHCVLGADAILATTGSLELARAFLLHDAHEAYCKDIPSPLAAAFAGRVGALVNAHFAEAWAERVFPRALREMKAEIDGAIHAAAGATWPLAPEIAEQVKAWDLGMLATERRQLLGPSPKPWHPSVEDVKPARLRGRITVWPWPRAADEWRMRLYQLFPHLKPAA